MSRISSAKNYSEFHVSGSSATLNTKYSIEPERERSAHDIRVPSQNWKIYRSVWKNNELRRIKTASRIISKEERGRQAEKFEADRKRLEWESEQRKRFLQEIDKSRQAKLTKKPNILDTHDDTEKILDRVFLAKQEEIEEVKLADRLILAAKCRVVRDAQINEKQELSREQREEELRLEKLMLSECEVALAEEKKRQDEMKSLKKKYANELREQLHNRETKKFLEAKHIEEEAKVLAKAKMALLNDRLAEQREKQERINKTRNEFKQSFEASNFYKNLAYEEQRTAEMKAQEYMRMKREREIRLEHDRRLEREKKQREADRWLTLQTKLLQTKKEQESMTMRRMQEQKEREFRQKERDAVIKKKEIELDVSRSRQMQMVEMKRIRDKQSAAERADYDRTINEFKEAKKKELENKRQLTELKEKYRIDILTQIDQKKFSKQENQKRIKNESTVQEEQEKVRQANIRNVIAGKLDAMRATKIPEDIVRNVERQLNIST